MKKFLKKAAIILGSAIVLAAIMLYIFLRVFEPEVVGQGGHSGKFTKEDLDEICGVELREREDDYGGVECMEYWNNRNTPTQFDDLRFYVFESSTKAQKAYNKIKRNYSDGIEEEGRDYFIGEEPGTMDAVVVNYFYIHNNLIIKTTAECYSEWATNPDDPDANQPYVVDRDELNKFVRRYF